MNQLYELLIDPTRDPSETVLTVPGQPPMSVEALDQEAARMAARLRDLGAKPGDRVMVQIGKSQRGLSLFLACVRAGFVYLPLNVAYTASEVEYFVSDARPAVLVVDPVAFGPIASIGDRSQVVTMDSDGEGSLSDGLAGITGVPVVDRVDSDLTAILYTSGTTGRSKGAMLSQANLVCSIATLIDAWEFSANDVLLHTLPIFHTHGLFVAAGVALASGASMIFLPRFDVDAAIAELPGATTMMGVPTHYTRLLADARFNHDLVSHMRLFTSGSAPMREATHGEFQTRTGSTILERYGMTETNMITSNPYRGERKPGTVGPALPGNEVRIVDGVIETRGRNVFAGYWDRPEAAASAFRSDGFFITGDQGTIDEEGYVTIVGRSSDMIISGGLNVYPKEIEQHIDLIDGVTESAAFAVPHADLGEAVVVACVLEAGRADVSLADIAAHLDGKLARFKFPKHVAIVDALPRNAMAKVQKAQLRDRYQSLFASSDALPK